MLELTNAARGRALEIPIVPGEPFSVTYHHSMYDQPVTEEFVVGPEGEIVLQAVSSPSAAVREYFGITAAGERHAGRAGHARDRLPRGRRDAAAPLASAAWSARSSRSASTGIASCCAPSCGGRVRRSALALTRPMAPGDPSSGEPAIIDEASRRKAEEFIEKEEGAARRLSGFPDGFVTWTAVAMSLFHLYAAYAIVPAQILRATHVGFVLFLLFLVFPAAKRFRDRIRWFDVALALLGVATIAYILVDFDEFIERAVTPTRWDLFFGVVLIVLVLEGVRRTSGLFLMCVVASFIVYAFAGPYLPRPWTHRGYDVERLVGQLYMTLEGIFGTPIDVSATFIILFTIYGAVLQYSGAGEFFIDFSLAVTGGTRAAAGRTIVLASFLLGAPSGSGVATTVTLGSVAYPMLARAGYPKNAAGGLLAAGGLGAIISPPVLGAAAFLIAEFLKISYMDVIWMATIPTALYYLALFLMVELDARKLGVRGDVVRPRHGVWRMLRERGFHFTSLVAVVVFMVLGFSPIIAVFWATALAAGLSFLRRDTALTPLPPRGERLHHSKLVQALRGGSVGVLGVAATCAAPGSSSAW